MFKELYESFITETVLTLIEAGGELVEEKEFLRRKEICNGCKFLGTVTPLPLLSMQGCTLCGCPTETKGRTKIYFNINEGKLVEATCPINLWET